ncbi:MAG: sugar phosphate isomerase/epimerase family protein [Promethearchaeota archaeon]
MKLKIPTSITFALDNRFLRNFGKLFENLLKFLKPLGYQGLELDVLRPENVPVKEMNEILESFQMEIASIRTGETFTRMGYSIGHPDADIRARAIERLSLYTGFATEVKGAPEIIVGKIRGRRMEGQTPQDERVNLIESLKNLEGIIQDLNIRLVLEPINRFEADSIHLVSEAIDLIKEANIENTYPMIDTFHACIEENPETFFTNLNVYARLVRKVDLAGCNRRAPGPGPFNFKKFIKTLVENGYWRYFTIDCVPKPSFEEMAKSAVDFLEKIT